MRKQMVRFLMLVLIFGFLPQFAFAGGIDNKQNWSARYMATGSRNAATDGADIAAYNPAGIAQQADGLVMELDIQYISKDYTHNYTQFNPPGSVSKEQEEPSMVPGLFATYKMGDLAFFGTITNTGGGGEVNYKKGNAITNNVEGLLMQSYGGNATLVGMFGAAAAAQLGVTENESIEAESFYITYTVGTVYKINEMFAVGGGIRWVDTNKDVKAHADFTNYNAAVHPDQSVGIDYTEEADGWGWVASLNFKPRKDLLFGLRYESRVNLEWETNFNKTHDATEVNILTNLGKRDGGTFDHDLPAVLGFGVGWDASDKLNFNTSFTYYFEEDADWDGLEDKVNNSFDWAVSFTYSVREDLRVSAGYMYTDVGMNADDFDLTAQMSPVLDASSFFFGLGYDFSEHLTTEFGAAIMTYHGLTSTAGVEYEKVNKAVSCAIIYKF